MSVDKEIPAAASQTDMELFQTACERNNAIKVDDFEGGRMYQRNPTNRLQNESTC